MGQRINFTKFIPVFALALLLGLSTPGYSAQLGAPQDREERQTNALKEEVRHQLVTLPYYSVFDWLEAKVANDGTVTLMGQVTEPRLKSDAEWKLKRLESATGVVNNIEVLPLSGHDDQLRMALYRAIYANESPLFKYALQSVGPIHIIVRNGRVTLKGLVASQADSQLAYMAARGVSGVFDVQNELKVEETTKSIS
jgi:hyperosmotically inducible periplasmic protein